MRKIFGFLLIGLVMLGITACGGDVQPNVELHSLAFVEGKEVVVNETEYVAVFCTYTNNSGETALPCEAFDVKAFQNGIELTIIVYTGQRTEDAIQCDTSVQTGTTTEVVWLFEKQDDSKVSVEISNGEKYEFELAGISED